MITPFSARVGFTLSHRDVRTVQINMGKLCNQACLHCHVNAGPTRTENMTAETVDRVLQLLRSSPGIRTVDLTGGAPEMNPNFRHLVIEARALGLHVIDRCNLTVLSLPEQHDTAEFLAAHRVEVVASLPCYTRENVESQRGKGVFGASIEGLRTLNALGYGLPNTGLTLSLVYNPGGAFLPPAQERLQADYQARLWEDFQLRFNRLITITNMPIARFKRDLDRQGLSEEYMRLLHDGFNRATVAGLMCLDQVSIGHDGTLYDCDFNQMLDMPMPEGCRTLWDLESFQDLSGEPVDVADHCYGCTAGCGSSCGGALTE